MANLVSKYEAERRVERAVAAIDSVRDGIALFDKDGNFTYVNEAYAEYYGYGPNDLIGTSWEPLYPKREVERYVSEVEAELERSGNYTGVFTGKRRDGTTFQSRHSISMMNDGSHVCVVHNGTLEGAD